MSNLFPRKVSLTVGNQSNALDLSQMQFKFEVLRGDIQTPNTGTFRVYNLSKQTVNRLRSGEFTDLVFQGGYAANFGLIHKGSIKYTYTGNDNATDSYIDLVSADGDEAYNFAVMNMTLAAGSTPQDHVNAAASAMAEYGVTFNAGDNPEFTGNKLPRGKVFYKLARDVLRRTASDGGANWSIQDGQLGFILQTDYRPGDIIELTSATGLVGFPVQTQNGIIIRSLLNPAIKMSGLVKIDNASIQGYRFPISPAEAGINSLVPDLSKDGVYKVLYTQCHGDTRGNDYYTEMTCISADPTAAIPPQLIPRMVAGPIAPGPVKPFVGP